MRSGDFKDYFSGDSGKYRQYRPVYPEALFAYLASIAPSSAVAWDCATGSGQAARQLARYFSMVVATDASTEQIRNGGSAENIYYQAARAEHAPLRENTVDVITVAQALHWFDPRAFFGEAGRVLKNRGILAVWSYNLLSLTPELDEIIKYFYRHIVGAYWPPERRLVEEGYQDMPFPFTCIACPDFRMSAEWSLEELLGYLGTWSAVKVYREKTGADPVEIIKDALSRTWGEPSRRRGVSWPLSVRAGEK